MMKVDPDAQSSTGLEVASSTTVNLETDVTRSACLPYGAVRGDDNLTIDHGWLNQVSDGTAADGGTGLVYLNARYYDPVLSRFVSPDPLMKPSDPITLDPYQYAGNNPITFTDASGLCYTGPGPRGYVGSVLEDKCNERENGRRYANPNSPSFIARYQVANDPSLVWYRPGIAVTTPRVEMTRTESDLLGSLPWDTIRSLNDLKNRALNDEAPARFPGAQHNTHADAFRHAYWNAAWTKRIGSNWTAQFTTAHEGNPSHDAVLEEVMDLYNNQVGRQIAELHPDASYDELADLIEDAVYRGELLVVGSDGLLHWSDSVPIDGKKYDVVRVPAPGVRQQDEFTDWALEEEDQWVRSRYGD